MKRSALRDLSKRGVLPFEAMLRETFNRGVFCVPCCNGFALQKIVFLRFLPFSSVLAVIC